MRALRELAMQDPLTSLPNRRVLLEALDLATKLPPAAGCSHANFLLDLNDFKCVNDRYGHAVGDEVLQAVVERFRRVARGNDVFARLGGDEFAVLMAQQYDIFGFIESLADPRREISPAEAVALGCLGALCI